MEEKGWYQERQRITLLGEGFVTALFLGVEQRVGCGIDYQFELVYLFLHNCRINTQKINMIRMLQTECYDLA